MKLLHVPVNRSNDVYSIFAINLLMSQKVEGSSPRKTIKRTHNNNRTFHSFLVFDALHTDPHEQSPVPQIQGINQILYKNSKSRVFEEYMTPKAKSTQKIQIDSLNRAQQEFSKNKLRNPVYFREQVVKDSEQSLHKFGKQRAKSTNALQNANSFINKLNFRNDNQIRFKQLVGYDIISNV